MHVGIVAEGPSDLILIEALIKAYDPASRVTRIQPEPTLGTSGSGWRGVKAWCEEAAQDLTVWMSVDPDSPMDVLVVHVDCSMAHVLGVDEPCPPASRTARALRRIVAHQWLGISGDVPDWLKIVTPASSTDTWFAAAAAPLPAVLGSVECIWPSAVENHLVSKRVFKRKSDGRMAKPGRRCEAVAKLVVEEIDGVRAACPEADRFCGMWQ